MVAITKAYAQILCNDVIIIFYHLFLLFFAKLFLKITLPNMIILCRCHQGTAVGAVGGLGIRHAGTAELVAGVAAARQRVRIIYILILC